MNKVKFLISGGREQNTPIYISRFEVYGFLLIILVWGRGSGTVTSNSVTTCDISNCIGREFLKEAPSTNSLRMRYYTARNVLNFRIIPGSVADKQGYLRYDVY